MPEVPLPVSAGVMPDFTLLAMANGVSIYAALDQQHPGSPPLTALRI